MKLLLTSAGVTNASILDALVELLGKPIAESTALCIPTAMYGHPMVGSWVRAWQFISGSSPNPMVDLGWKVCRRAGADGAAQPQQGVLGSAGPAG